MRARDTAVLLPSGHLGPRCASLGSGVGRSQCTDGSSSQRSCCDQATFRWRSVRCAPLDSCLGRGHWAEVTGQRSLYWRVLQPEHVLLSGHTETGTSEVRTLGLMSGQKSLYWSVFQPALRTRG